MSETVRQLYRALLFAKIRHEILVVNDNSSDLTEEKLNELTKEIKTLKIIFNPSPNGFGSAVRKGFEYFCGDMVVVYMADASDSPTDLVRYYRAMVENNADCVFGTRFAKESKVVDYPFWKFIINRLANLFIQILFRLKYNDTTNAFKMYRRHTIEGLKPFLSRHFNLTVELPLKAIIRGYHYIVLPNDWANRKTGISKLQIKEMGSRCLFIVLYCFLEKWLSKGDYKKISDKAIQASTKSNVA
ncbi:MAG: glycosyltransferase family 2 protein [Deltaproteobacteria bacterium]|nr:glycosyltransferase family 2 protein [Deltaproteobacteria bacterium]